jgi:hypothetical protein
MGRNDSEGHILVMMLWDTVNGGSTFRKPGQESVTRWVITGQFQFVTSGRKRMNRLKLRDVEGTQVRVMLLKYKEYFTKKPGKCKLKGHKFEVLSAEPS